MGADEGQTKTPPGSGQYAAAAEKLRETAKWLVATFGALGAALVASLSLTNLGKVSGADLGLAILGFGLGLVGTAVMIGSVGGVLTTTSASLADLSGPQADPNIAELLARSAHMLRGFESVDSLVLTHTKAQASFVVSSERMLHPRATDTKDIVDKLDADAKRAKAELDLTSPIIERILGFAAFHRLQRRFRRSIWLLSGGLILAAFGVGIFAYYSSPPSPDSDAAPALAGRPTEAIVRLNSEGQDTFGEMLGAGCNLEQLGVLAVDSTETSVEVIVLPDQSCNVESFDVTPETGNICPVDLAIRPALPPSPRAPGNDDEFIC